MESNDIYIQEIIRQYEQQHKKYIEDMNLANKMIDEINMAIQFKDFITISKKIHKQFMMKHLVGCNSYDDFCLHVKNMSNREKDMIVEILYHYVEHHKLLIPVK
jgi:hypothetical protein